MGEECPGGKSSWPELVGKRGEEAKAIIEKENPNVTAEILSEDEMILTVIICTRVVVRVNDSGIVVGIPIVG
ncbi:PREDICTED: inhibitor of trypsin and hageman factor-like [Tarenaya hassleriana]|uniref:inhibitor of trypsin and hageman factor-like n=1 Tax=Tarenaya hassleriana TaxID=28532 RepID=UPI00053C6888|nr:PREDICTED: inhibitor of trypsin and hageman factor-like [Tarenaya hassleriana]